jgi:hypothetical protein
VIAFDKALYRAAADLRHLTEVAVAEAEQLSRRARSDLVGGDQPPTPNAGREGGNS